jgi:DNA-binding NtrC family response regulator
VARILLVEDDEPSRDAMAEVLALYGHEVRSAGTAVEACRLLDREGPGFDVLVTDVYLPGGSFTILEHARSHRPRVPVVMMTGSFETRLRDRALKRGADCFVAKPLSGAMLNRLVEQALEHRLEPPRRAPAEGPPTAFDGGETL